MEIVDAQVHLSREMTAEATLAAMDWAGVGAAIATPPFLVSGYDASVAMDAAARYPRRFVVVAALDPDAPLLDERVAAWRSRQGVVGVRVLLRTARDAESSRGGPLRRVLDAAERYAVPVCVFSADDLAAVGAIARAHPSLSLILDHLGMPTEGDPGWARLPALLELAPLPNIALKMTAVPVHSRTGYPFADLWPALHRIIEAFGVERIVWGSDWTRVKNASYGEGVAYVRDTTELSAREKELILGANLRRIFRWGREG